EYLPQPCDFFLVAADALAIAVRSLVTPVGTDTKFGLLVHIEGAYLHFEHLAFGADHRRVQRAIAVVLRIGDVVVEFIRHIAPQAMHDAERAVAIPHLGHQYAHGANIVDLRKADTLALHFSPDAVDMLGAPGKLRGDAGARQCLAQFSNDVLYIALSVEDR